VTERVLTPLEEKALMWRHREACKILKRLDPFERVSMLAAVVAPSPQLYRLSMDAVAGEIPDEEQLALFKAVAA
jgi:hypothetical protein